MAGFDSNSVCRDGLVRVAGCGECLIGVVGLDSWLEILNIFVKLALERVILPY